MFRVRKHLLRRSKGPAQLAGKKPEKSVNTRDELRQLCSVPDIGREAGSYGWRMERKNQDADPCLHERESGTFEAR